MKHSDTQDQAFRTHSRSPRSYVTLKIRRRHSCRCPRLAISSSTIALSYVVLVLRGQSSRQQCNTLCISSRANKISRTKPVLDEGTFNQPLHFSDRREESYLPLFHFERRSLYRREEEISQKIGRYRRDRKYRKKHCWFACKISKRELCRSRTICQRGKYSFGGVLDDECRKIGRRSHSQRYSKNEGGRKKVKSRECDPVLTRLERYASKTSSIHGIVSWRQHCNKLDMPKNNEENNGRK